MQEIARINEMLEVTGELECPEVITPVLSDQLST